MSNIIIEGKNLNDINQSNFQTVGVRSSFYFTQQIRTLWNKTKWGYNEIHIDQPIDNGWINYITKTRSSDKIDWVNFNRNN